MHSLHMDCSCGEEVRYTLRADYEEVFASWKCPKCGEVAEHLIGIVSSTFVKKAEKDLK